MTRPCPTRLYHFTRLEHLTSIARNGLLCDGQAQRLDRLAVEIGNVGIKERRRRRVVPVGPGGVVADYTPFYFAPRSPMLYAIHRGNVPTYAGGQAGLIYLCTTLERVVERRLAWVASDRNAVLGFARFSDRDDDLDHLVDWPLMTEQMWANTPDDGERRERRMAELLVHGLLPWAAIQFIGTRTAADLATVRQALASLGPTDVPRSAVRGDWYF